MKVITGIKIIAATTKGGLDDAISPVFGRSQTFSVVEVKGGEIKSTSIISNPYTASMGGAGIQAAQLVINEGANAVIAGSFGPNAYSVLAQAGVEIVQAQGIVRDVIMKYLRGEIKAMSQPSAAFGRGMGRGFGRGCGWGLGIPQTAAQPTEVEDISMLRNQVQMLKEELGRIKRRLKALEEGK